jgi:hypothetical protein
MRETVWQRANGRCEYCGLHQEDAFEAHEADHIISEQHRGETNLDNLALACWECNRRKGPNLSSVDPATGEIVRLFNPRLDEWPAHFRFDEERIVAKTAIGRATEALLRLNSVENLALRRLLSESGRFPSG